jgi:hypothetical protein
MKMYVYMQSGVKLHIVYVLVLAGDVLTPSWWRRNLYRAAYAGRKESLCDQELAINTYKETVFISSPLSFLRPSLTHFHILRQTYSRIIPQIIVQNFRIFRGIKLTQIVF